MEKIKLQAARKYCFLSCHRYMTFTAHKEFEESIILNITNEGGDISFIFTNLSTNEVVMRFDNPNTGEYIIPLVKGQKTKLEINASKAIGSYDIKKRTIKYNY